MQRLNSKRWLLLRKVLGSWRLDAQVELVAQTKGWFMKITVSLCVPEIMVISLSPELRNLNAQWEVRERVHVQWEVTVSPREEGWVCWSSANPIHFLMLKSPICSSSTFPVSGNPPPSAIPFRSLTQDLPSIVLNTLSPREGLPSLIFPKELKTWKLFTSPPRDVCACMWGGGRGGCPLGT